MMLSPQDLNRLALALVDSGIAEQQETLRKALRPRTRASLIAAGTPFQLIFSDLDSLNTTPLRREGERAFEAWLERAQALAPDDETADALGAALAIVRQPTRPLLLDLDSPEAEEWEPLAPGIDGDLEAMLGESDTMLHLSFLSTGIVRSRAVVRLVRADGVKGTGFLIAGDRIVTAAHVLPSQESTAGLRVDFEYQERADGALRAEHTAAVEPTTWRCAPKDDLAVVRLLAPPPPRFEPLPLGAPSPLLPSAHVHIVQHPGGGGKRINFFRNLVTWVGPDLVQYLTDTMPGSSGAPVFDRDWNVVAIHHAGRKIPPLSSGVRVVGNQGVRVERLLAIL